MSKAAELANLIGNINAGGGGVGRNLVVNGAMSVAQRGTSFAGPANGAKTLDQFRNASSHDGAITITQDSSGPDGFANSLKVDVTTADTSIAASQYQHIWSRIEAQNLQHLKFGTSDAQNVTLSFYVKSNKTGTYAVVLAQNDNSFKQATLTYTINSANTWERKSLTFNGDTSGVINDDTGSGLEINFILAIGSNYTSGSASASFAAYADANYAVGHAVNLLDSTDNEWLLTGVQLEVGQNETTFEHKPYVQHLLDCQRYCFVVDATDDNEGSSDRSFGLGTYYNDTSVIVYIDTPVEMRATPSLSVDLNSNSHWLQSYVGASGQDSNAGLNVGHNGNNTAHRLYFTSSHSSRTAGESSWNQVRDGARFVMASEL